MKAKELQENLFPRPELVKAYEDVGQKYELTIHDRIYQQWYPIVTANPKLKEQEIWQRINQLYRYKDYKGKEWLLYDITLQGHDWQGNKKEFYYREGLIDQMPEFERQVDPQTDQVIPNTTQATSKKYTLTIYKVRINFDIWLTANQTVQDTLRIKLSYVHTCSY